MGIQVSRSDVKSAETSVVIIRADGRIEDLGVVAYYHKNPIKRLIWNAKRLIKLFIKGE